MVVALGSHAAGEAAATRFAGSGRNARDPLPDVCLPNQLGRAFCPAFFFGRKPIYVTLSRPRSARVHTTPAAFAFHGTTVVRYINITLSSPQFLFRTGSLTGDREWGGGTSDQL